MHHSFATVPLSATAAMLYALLPPPVPVCATSSRSPRCSPFSSCSPSLSHRASFEDSSPSSSSRSASSSCSSSPHGPLDPRIRPLPFVFTAALPVKLRQVSDNSAAVTKTKTAAVLLPSGVKFAIAAALVHHLHRAKERTHPYAVFVLICVIIYCCLDSALPFLAATGMALGMELEPQFNKPYLAASLQDFWGRRWNLMVSAVLRPSVYNPVRGCLGAAAGVLAAFLVSGLMHEVVAYYMTLRAPTGQVTVFFVLHGVSVCAERWCARRCCARPPRVVATPLIMAFVASTACWLFLPALFGDGMVDLYLAETAVLASSFRDAGARFLRLGTMVLSVYKSSSN